MIQKLFEIIHIPYRQLKFRLFDDRNWKQRMYSAPSPKRIKDEVLIRNGYSLATWVETGTYLGETTSLLAKHAPKVYSVEPSAELFRRATARFRNDAGVKILNGTSEEVFPNLLPTLVGKVNFWLDGHFSAGITYQGATTTPIVVELQEIEKRMPVLEAVCVLVDDVRCFDGQGYPPLDFLVDWARRNSLIWHIEHDIFVAKTS